MKEYNFSDLKEAVEKIVESGSDLSIESSRTATTFSQARTATTFNQARTATTFSQTRM